MAKEKVEKPPKPPGKKLTPQQKKKLYWGGGLGFLGLIIMMALSPAQGSVRYGICRVYVELNELYPDQIKYLTVEEGEGPVIIYYKKVDPFGVDSVNSIECTFKRDSSGNYLNELSKVDINGPKREYEAEKLENIKRFNFGIPAILSNPPDLTIPYFSQDDISRYKDIQ